MNGPQLVTLYQPSFMTKRRVIGFFSKAIIDYFMVVVNFESKRETSSSYNVTRSSDVKTDLYNIHGLA